MTGQCRLPRGPHGLSAEQVTASQRHRISTALTELVGARGYVAVTIADIVRQARVSKSAFYAHFRDKEHAFIDTMSSFAAWTHREVTEAALDNDSPLEAVRRGNHRIAQIAVEQPVEARCVFTELVNAGAPGLALLDHTRHEWEATFSELAAWFRREDPTLPTLSPHASHYVVAGTFALAADGVRDGTPTARRRALEAIFELWLTAATGRTTVDMTLPDAAVYHQVSGQAPPEHDKPA